MQINWLVLLAAAVVPLITGFLWYSPFMFVKPWMASIGVTPDDAKGKSMVLPMIVLFISSFFLAFSLQFIVIHQNHVASVLMGQPGFDKQTGDVYTMYMDFMSKYGHEFRTFKHGALHGAIAGVFIALPLIAGNAFFEGRGIKYVAITAGSWILNLIIMGGIVCQWG